MFRRVRFSSSKGKANHFATARCRLFCSMISATTMWMHLYNEFFMKFLSFLKDDNEEKNSKLTKTEVQRWLNQGLSAGFSRLSYWLTCLTWTETSVRYLDKILYSYIHPYAGVIDNGFILMHGNAQPLRTVVAGGLSLNEWNRHLTLLIWIQ